MATAVALTSSGVCRSHLDEETQRCGHVSLVLLGFLISGIKQGKGSRPGGQLLLMNQAFIC